MPSINRCTAMVHAIKEATEPGLAKIGNMWYAGKKGGRSLDHNHWLIHLRDALHDANKLIEAIHAPS